MYVAIGEPLEDANREQSVVEVLDRAILFEREIKAPLPAGLERAASRPESRAQMMSGASQAVKNGQAIKWL